MNQHLWSKHVVPRGHVLCGVPLNNNRRRDLSDLTLYHAISLEVRYAFDEYDKIGSGFLHNLQQNIFLGMDFTF